MSLVTQINSALTRIGTEFKTVYGRQGDLASLATTDKTSLVAAINEVDAAVGSGGTITADSITFYEGDTARTGTYAYSGYQILTYESGKKGVRYLFERTDDAEAAPKYVQFSDHIIEPTASAHFHIYLGDDSHAALLEEMDNWPTFYLAGMDGDEIVEEMLHH